MAVSRRASTPKPPTSRAAAQDGARERPVDDGDAMFAGAVDLPGKFAAFEQRDAHGVEVTRAGEVGPRARALRHGNVRPGALERSTKTRHAAAERKARGDAGALDAR